MGASFEACNFGFRAFLSRGKSMYTVEEPGGAPYVLPTTGVKADVSLQCPTTLVMGVTTLVMGGNGLRRPGRNSGFRV